MKKFKKCRADLPCKRQYGRKLELRETSGMAQWRFGPLLRQIRRLATPAQEEPVSDRQLLRRFIDTRDQSAFAQLVERHGGMVVGVCRRLLYVEADVEDVFQATFLVLAKKAASVGNPDALAGWLYGVALRLARKARAEVARRAAQPPREVAMTQADPPTEAAWTELREVLDEELGRLPARYRDPLVLCYLEGKSRGEIAQQLAWSEGAVKGKLERGRELLRGRLAQRGVALSSGTLAALLTEHASAKVAAAWVENTAVAAALFAEGKLAAGAGPALAEALLRNMALAHLRAIGTLLIIFSVATIGAGAMAKWVLAGGGHADAAETPMLVASEPNVPKPPPIRLDRHGDPLPVAALSRLGTARLHHAGFGPIAFGREGQTVASIGAGELIIWDCSTAKEQQRIALPPREYTSCVQVSPDGAIVATASLEGTIRLWESATGKLLRSCGKPRQRVEALAFAADGKALVACSSSDRGIISFWNAETGASMGEAVKQAQVERRDRYVLSSDGTVIASWHDGNSSITTIWDVNPAKAEVTRRQVPNWMKHGGEVTAATFAPDKRFLVTAAKEAIDSQVRVWDMMTGKETRRLSGLEGDVLALAMAPDGKRVVSVGRSKLPTITDVGECVARVQDLETGKELCRLRWPGEQFVGTPLRDLMFAPDGKSLAARRWSAILLWDSKTGELIHRDTGPSTGMTRFAFAPDGQTIATTASSGGSPAVGDVDIRLWDPATGKELRRLEGHAMPPTHLIFSPNGKTLLSGSRDQSVRLWDVASSKELQRIQAEPHALGFVAFGQEGKTILYQSYSKPLRFWDVVEKRELHPFSRENSFHVQSCTPDANVVVLIPAKGDAVLHDLRTHKEIVLEEFRSVLDAAMAFSPDGKMLAGLNRSKRTVYIWDTQSGRRGRSLAVGCRALFGSALVFSPDNSLLAVGDPEDNVIHLCNPQSGREVGRFRGQQGGVWTLAFSPDGKRLVSGGGDGTALVWDMAAQWPPAALDIERTPRELEDLWSALASPSEHLAYQALWDLVDSPAQVVPLCRDRVPPAKPVDAQMIARLIADLGSERFAERQKAAEELEKIGESAEQALSKALMDKPSLDVGKRLEALLKKVHATRGERQRELRAVEILEHIGTREARETLEAMTRGRPDSPLTRDAKSALERMTDGAKP